MEMKLCLSVQQISLCTGCHLIVSRYTNHPLLTSTGNFDCHAGDRYIKPFIIPKPEVRVVPRTNGDDCLILASDGLWDVISNEDACRAARLHILRWHKKNNGTCFGEGGKLTISESDPASQAAAECLVRLALSRGSEDNITVIVIDLKRRKMHGQR